MKTERKCTLDDATLIETIDKIVDTMYTDGKIPTRSIPARPNEDFDFLISELILRYMETAL